MTDPKDIEKAFLKEFKKSEELLISQIHFEFNKLLNMLSELEFKEKQIGGTYLKMTVSAVREGQDYFNTLEKVSKAGGVLDRSSNAKPL